MKNIFTISLCFLALSLSAQETITYPYNPDGDADGLVAVPDIQDLLAVYGSPFSPAEIMVGDTALSEWIQILYQALQDQQAVIEAMQGAGGPVYLGDMIDIQAEVIPGQDFQINQDGFFLATVQGTWPGTCAGVKIKDSLQQEILDYFYCSYVELFLPIKAGQYIHTSGNVNIHGFIPLESSGGSSEGEEEELGPCQGEFTVNYHGYDYELVEIGDQCWYKENARYLPTINSPQEHSSDIPTFHVNNFYGNDIEEAKASYMYKTYGVYYNFPAIEEWDICPLGWRVPSIDDWNQFKEYINQSSDGLHIMEEYLNYSGFSGRFGGWHGVDNFNGTESQAFWWSTSPVDNSFYSPRVTNSGLSLNTNVTNTYYFGANIRCIKD